MTESGLDQPPNKFKVTKEWIESDPIAKEIRNIAERVINAYDEFLPSGQDIGIVLNSQKQTLQHELDQAFHDLEEFDVTEDMHINRELEFYQSNPRRMAEYVGGQLLTLRHIPPTANLEKDKAAEYTKADFEAGLEVEESGPEELLNMQMIVTILTGAQKFLAIKGREDKVE